jgi:hypothetical protein
MTCAARKREHPCIRTARLHYLEAPTISDPHKQGAASRDCLNRPLDCAWGDEWRVSELRPRQDRPKAGSATAEIYSTKPASRFDAVRAERL